MATSIIVAIRPPPVACHLNLNVYLFLVQSDNDIGRRYFGRHILVHLHMRGSSTTGE